MKTPTRLSLCVVSCFVMLAAGCVREVPPPSVFDWHASRGECERPYPWRWDLSELDAEGGPYRLYVLVVGEWRRHDRSHREDEPEAFHAIVVFQRYPLTDWGFAECRRVGESEGRAFLAGLKEDRRRAVSGWESVVVFGLPAAVALFALTGWFRGRRRRREREGEGDAGVSRSAAGEGPAKVLVYRLSLGLYAGFAAAWIHAAPVGGPGRIGLCLAIALLVGACFAWNWARLTVAVLAGIHIALALLFHALLLGDVMDSVGAIGIPWLLFFHLVVPLTGCLIPSGVVREPVPLNLPAGYDYSLTRKRGLSPLWRIVTAILMIVIGGVVFLGGPAGLLLFAVFVMPVIIAAYFIFHFLTGRKDGAPAAQRRFRLSPKLEKPAQTRHYWTVDTSEYQDPELYRQDDARPRISRDSEDDSA